MCIEQMSLIDHTTEALKTRTIVSMAVIADNQVEVGHGQMQLQDAIYNTYLEYYKKNKDQAMNKLKELKQQASQKLGQTIFQHRNDGFACLLVIIFYVEIHEKQ